MTTTTANNEEEDILMHPGTRYESVLLEKNQQANEKDDLVNVWLRGKTMTILECYDDDEYVSSFRSHIQRQQDFYERENGRFAWTTTTTTTESPPIFDLDDFSNQFFEMYPECQRDDESSSSSSSSESSQEEEVEIIAHQPTRRISSTQGPSSHESIPNKRIRNPYSSHPVSNDRSSSSSHANTVPSNRHSYSTPPKNNSQSTNAWDTYHHHQSNKNSNNPNGIPHPNHMPSHNPFCTANEFVVEDNQKTTNDNHHYQHNHYTQQHGRIDNPPQTYNHNPMEHGHPNNNNNNNTNTNTAQGSFNVHRPNMSAGLKKKFQLPKPKPSTSPKNSSSAGGMATKKNSSKKEDSEEELPEELAHLDKELVDKIENEIFCGSDQTKITFDDIAGLQNAKQTVLELVCWPMKRPDLFTGLRKGPNGLLLFGPPGTGKTLVGKAIASESGATFFSISSSSLTSKWIGEGEKLVRTLFAVAAYKEPAVVFIDEIDSLLTQRKSDENEASRRIKTEFLVQLDGTGTAGQGRVLVIGATNRPHELDDAARRRFVKRLYIPLPEQEDRQILLTNLLQKNKHSLSHKEIHKLSVETHGYSGADLKALCTDAAMGPIRQLGIRAMDISADDVPPISYKHFKYALRSMSASVAQEDLDVYIEWNNTYGNKSIGPLPSSDDDDDDDDEE